MKPWPKIILITGLVLLAGCYSKDFQEPGVNSVESFNTERTLDHSYNTTWNGVLQVMKDVPIIVARKESGLVVTDWIMGKSDKLFSGYGDTQIPAKIRYKLNIRLRPSGQNTVVRITNEEQFYSDVITSGGEFSGALYHWVDTSSSTNKERNLLDSFEEYLAKNTPPGTN